MGERPEDRAEVTRSWIELIEVATRHGYGYAGDTPHPELMTPEHYAQLAMALWRAAEAKRGGPLTELAGVSIGDAEFVGMCASGKVAL